MSVFHLNGSNAHYHSEPALTISSSAVTELSLAMAITIMNQCVHAGIQAQILTDQLPIYKQFMKCMYLKIKGFTIISFAVFILISFIETGTGFSSWDSHKKNKETNEGCFPHHFVVITTWKQTQRLISMLMQYSGQLFTQKWLQF